MYLIYDFKNKLIQFSYCNIDETSESRGIILFQKINYYSDSKLFYFSVEVKLKNHCKIPDNRLYIKSNIINLILYFFFSLIKYLYLLIKYFNCKNKYLKLIKYIFFIFVFILIFFKFFSDNIYKNYKKNDFNINVSLNEWIELINKNTLKIKLENNQTSYILGTFPNIKGIHDFKVISLGDNILIDRYLAASFKRVIAVNNNVIKYLYPIENCYNNNTIVYSVYEISRNDKVIIFEKISNISSKLLNNFVISPKNVDNKIYSNKKICDYLILE